MVGNWESRIKIALFETLVLLIIVTFDFYMGFYTIFGIGILYIHGVISDNGVASRHFVFNVDKGHK